MTRMSYKIPTRPTFLHINKNTTFNNYLSKFSQYLEMN